MKTEFNSSAKIHSNMPLVVIIIFIVIMAIVTIVIGTEEIISTLPVLVQAFSFSIGFALVIHLFTSKENKQVEITERGLTFFYGKREERHSFDEYDGYMIVNAESTRHGYMTYLYLVKDHKRIDVINLEIYKNRSAFRTELDKHLKCLGRKEIIIFKHWLGGEKVEY